MTQDRDELIKELSKLTWRIEDKEFGNTDVQAVDAPALTIVADFILARERSIREEYEAKISELKHAQSVQSASDSQTIEGLTAERDHYRISVNNLQAKISEARNALEGINRYFKPSENPWEYDKGINKALEVLK